MVMTLSGPEFPRLQTKISNFLLVVPQDNLQFKMSKTKLINLPFKSASSHVPYLSEWPHNVCNPSIYPGAWYPLGTQEIF